jgi:hypothetical protein
MAFVESITACFTGHAQFKLRAALMIPCIALLHLPLSAMAADNPNFSGSWTAWICPGGAPPDSGKCSSFALVLFQKNEKICGSHVFATAGARAMDEGGTPSLTGTIAGESAGITVESGRTTPGTRVQAQLHVSKGQLQWRRLDSPAGDYLLPASAHMTRSNQGSLLSPLFEQRLSAACTAYLNMPSQAEQDRPLPLPEQPRRSTP